LNRKNKTVRYFIIGFKSSGKTTIGKKLAHRLNMDFIDLDQEIERREGKSIPDLFVELGENEFRNKEWKALCDVVKGDNLVVSLGGGAPCHCDNMNLLERKGDVIYLKVDNDTLVSRLKASVNDRPIVLNKSDEELRVYVKDLKLRCEHHYLRAKYIVSGKDMTVDTVLQAIGKVGKTFI
jgi:shikimate kinase